MEPNKKQTAVEWFIEELFKKIDYTQVPQKLIDQAKEMEEGQHKETFKQSRQAKIFEKDMPPVWESFEQYYNETYKGDK
jgi:hypothetical protein